MIQVYATEDIEAMIRTYVKHNKTVLYFMAVVIKMKASDARLVTTHPSLLKTPAQTS